MNASAVDDIKMDPSEFTVRAAEEQERDTYIQTIKVFPPINQRWEPDRAQQLMASLFSV